MADASKPAEEPSLLVLVLCCGMTFGELAATIEKLKESSKSAGSHKRRELYWDAYSKMASKMTGREGVAHCFLLYRANAEGGAVELVELTKRQRGALSGGSVEVLGHKLRPPEAPSAKSWAMNFGEEDAQQAWEDLMGGEPCVYLTADAVYVGTRYKRSLCKALSGLPKTAKEAEALVGELAPEKPLKSVSFSGHAPPSVVRSLPLSRPARPCASCVEWPRPPTSPPAPPCARAAVGLQLLPRWAVVYRRDAAELDRPRRVDVDGRRLRVLRVEAQRPLPLRGVEADRAAAGRRRQGPHAAHLGELDQGGRLRVQERADEARLRPRVVRQVRRPRAQGRHRRALRDHRRRRGDGLRQVGQDRLRAFLPCGPFDHDVA